MIIMVEYITKMFLTCGENEYRSLTPKKTIFVNILTFKCPLNICFYGNKMKFDGFY